MKNLKQKAIHWYFNKFKLDDIYLKMDEIKEDSPWHREESIGIHTDMVISNYLSITNNEWNRNDLLGFLSCAFHDVGKPDSMIIKHNEERGEYRAFYGHEKISARMFVDVVLSSYLCDEFELTNYEIFKISWMIEYHKPWDIKKPYKVNALCKTVKGFFNNDYKVYTNALMSDTMGRIADNWDDSLISSTKWQDDFNNKVESTYLEMPKLFPTIYFPIGPSGSGKSTLFEKIKKEDPSVVKFSFDDYRLAWYGDDTILDSIERYEDAFIKANNDDKFFNKCHQEFIKLIKTGKQIYIDNTNLSVKRRRSFIVEAKKKGYTSLALLQMVPLIELYDRQIIRNDKTVSDSVVRKQFFALENPSYGEFDFIEVH